MNPSAKSYFSGAGLFDLGLIQGGINIIQSLEIDQTCCKTLRQNFSHKIMECDIREKTVLSQDKTDILIATYPCTKYSTIADIHGTRSGDELYLHFFRHLAIERPEMYILENIPGMKKFPIVMEAMTKLPDYYLNVFCPIDSLTWLPQKRERLILIGTKRRFTISPPIAKRRIKLNEIIESNPEMVIPEYVFSRLKGKYRDMPIVSDPEDSNSFAPTCVAHYSKDKGTRLVVDRTHPAGVRPYSTKEYARLQGVPDWFRFYGTDNEVYKQVGNGVSVPLGECIGKEAMKYFN
jgi:DNA (cytosine-5)-methyltransferase 1